MAAVVVVLEGPDKRRSACVTAVVGRRGLLDDREVEA